MAFTGTLCTEADITAKEGAGISSSVTEAMHNLWTSMAEGVINSKTRYDWVTNIASVSTEFKGILADCCSSLVAIYAIAYDMGGYNSLSEAESMITIQRDSAIRNINYLTDKNNQKAMGV